MSTDDPKGSFSTRVTFFLALWIHQCGGRGGCVIQYWRLADEKRQTEAQAGPLPFQVRDLSFSICWWKCSPYQVLPWQLFFQTLHLKL